MGYLHTCTRCRRRLPHMQFRLLPGTVNAHTSKFAKYSKCQDCQREEYEERKGDPVRFRKWEMRPYKNRDYTLRALGYASYADYLASETWAKIRARVLKKDKHTCKMCGDRATQVHHNVYDKRVLRGQSLKGLRSLCRACHESVEFDGRRKVGVVEASHRFHGSSLL